MTGYGSDRLPRFIFLSFIKACTILPTLTRRSIVDFYLNIKFSFRIAIIESRALIMLSGIILERFSVPTGLLNPFASSSDEHRSFPYKLLEIRIDWFALILIPIVPLSQLIYMSASRMIFYLYSSTFFLWRRAVLSRFSVPLGST